MAETKNMKVYKEEVTERGAMKIEVVLEEAKKKKRPASARSRHLYVAWRILKGDNR
jgi:hypothetical protein